ncbi:MAG: DUF4338 domain-containing protein [Acidimicrobiales bacterium]
MSMPTKKEKKALRQRVLDELANVRGHTALALDSEGTDAKDHLRMAHGTQRQELLDSSTEWLVANEDRMLEQFANGSDVDPAAIDPVVVPVRTQGDADTFRFAALQWSVPVSQGYGRRSRFLVRDRQNDKLLAIFALGDPVIAQRSREKAIGWTTEQRNLRLYNVYDAFVLGAVEPYRQLLGGKLVALLMLSNETRTFLANKYRGNTTEIAGLVKDPTPALITTSSALGRSSVYNRVTYRGTKMLHSVGFTEGYGHFQFSGDLFEELRSYARRVAEGDVNQAGRHQSNRFGKGPNWRFRVIRNALELLEVDEQLLQHNVRREVFLAPVAHNWDSYLRGDEDELDEFDLPTAQLAEYYRERWAVGRAERKPAFRFWDRTELRLTPQLSSRPVQLSLASAQVAAGRVELGAYHLRIGVGVEDCRGKAPSGRVLDGRAYLSLLEGPDTALTLADIEWEDGQREVVGWSGGSGSTEGLIRRHRVQVFPAKRFRDMAAMELRAAVVGRDQGISIRKTTNDRLSALVGFDVEKALDVEFGAVTGTRESLLRDDGSRRAQLCAVFPSADRAVPALVWALTRPLALLGESMSEGLLLDSPMLRRRPPSLEEFST